MTAYHPFLLPLLTSPDTREAADPLHEERLLRQHGTPPWDQLTEACIRHYGLPLLYRMPPATAGGGTGSAVMESPLQRCCAAADERALRWQDGTQRWFLISHPRDLQLFDTYAASDEQPALVIPTLFAQLLETAVAAHAPASRLATHTTQALGACLELLQQRLTQPGLSDWHIEPSAHGYRIRERIDGQLRPFASVDRDTGNTVLNSLLQEAGLGNAARNRALDGSIQQLPGSAHGMSLRLAFAPGIHGCACTIRIIHPQPTTSPDLQTIGFSRELATAITTAFRSTEGLWLICGPTGSGKTTTLHVLLRMAVADGGKVLSAEDPVEMAVAGVQQVSIGQPPGMTFARALRAFLRQSPDCVMLGEIRDAETAAIVLQATRSGHKVIASVHAANTRGLQRRFADFGIEALADGLLAPVVVHQRLLPRPCGGRCAIASVTMPQDQGQPPCPDILHELNAAVREGRIDRQTAVNFMSIHRDDFFPSTVPDNNVNDSATSSELLP